MAKASEEQKNQLVALITTSTDRRKWDGQKLQLWMDDKTFDDRFAAFINGYEPIPPPEPTAKFGLLADLGIITVPEDYVHDTCLTKFFDKNRKKFYDVNKNITDANFPHPGRILKPGDRLRVRAFKQIVGGTTTSEERMAFLAEQKTDVYTGAQGASLVFEQKRNELPKGFWYASFDEVKNLWKDADGYRRVPLVGASSGEAFRFRLGNLGSVWGGVNAFLGFSDTVE